MLTPPHIPPLRQRLAAILPPHRRVPLIVAVALFMENMDSTIIATSLPAIAVDLGTEPLALRLAVTCYLLSLAIVIPASGWLADRFGARTVFRIAIAIFMLGSIGCAFSDSLTAFVAARIVQGAGGAMMSPVGRLVIARSVDKRSLVQAIGWLTMPAMIGPIVGPPVGGFITTYFSWHWIFFINIPIGIAGILLVGRYIENLRSDTREKFDVTGWLLVGLGLAGLVFGLSVLGLAFVPWPVTATLIVVGGAFVGAYIVHARRHPAPVLDIGLLRLPTFRSNVVGGLLFRIGVGATPFLLPMMLQLGFHLSPFQSGLITVSSAVGAMQMKVAVPAILRRFGFRRTMMINGIISSAFIAACATFTPATPYAVMIVVLVTGGFFRSLQFTAITSIAYADLRPHEISRGSPVMSVVQQLSASAGIALGAMIVDATVAINGHAAPTASDFQPAFIVVGLVAAASVWSFWSLSADAGAELANRAPPSPRNPDRQSDS